MLDGGNTVTCKIRLCKTSEIPPGEMRGVDIEGIPPIAVYNIDGEFFATSNICTHATAMLTEGHLDGDSVECPLHGGCFNVRTGAPTSFPCEKPLRTFPLTVIGDELLTVIE